MTVNEITVHELSERLNAGEKLFILDVREQHEYDLVNIDGKLIPLGQLEGRLDEIAAHKDEEVIVHCRSGARSAEACKIMMANGFKNPKNVVGGINKWSADIDPSMPIY
jgi:sulfur-carrier protein adenylyltransferase/sulfurtransferase